jgi:hypothetical protein
MWYAFPMAKERKNYNTTLRVDHIRPLKVLAAEEDQRVNELLEEAIRDLLVKYGKKAPPK